jgi:hypothetical protein
MTLSSLLVFSFDGESTSKESVMQQTPHLTFEAGRRWVANGTDELRNAPTVHAATSKIDQIDEVAGII